MSISGVNGGALSGLFHQRRLDFRTLASAIDAGDTNAAQAALQSYQNDIASIDAVRGGTSDQSGADGGNGSNPLAAKIKTDLSDLASAVQSGNITDAQAALKTFREDRQSLRQGDAGQGSDPSPLVKDLLSFIKSIQSGDSDAAQTSAQALIKDLQSFFQSGGSEKTHGHHHHHRHDSDAPASSDANSAAPSTGQSQSVTIVLKQFTEFSIETSQQSTTQVVL